jgi:hypothetical protein
VRQKGVGFGFFHRHGAGRLESDPWGTSSALLQDALGDRFASLYHSNTHVAIVVDLSRSLNLSTR